MLPRILEASNVIDVDTILFDVMYDICHYLLSNVWASFESLVFASSKGCHNSAHATVFIIQFKQIVLHGCA